MLNRRTFFSATAAVTAMAAPALTVADVSADAALLDMGRQWEALVERQAAAEAEVRRLKVIFDRTKPRAPRLRITQEDLDRGVGMRTGRLGDIIGPEELRRIVRNAKTYTPDVMPTRYKWARRFIRADESYEQRLDDHSKAIGLMAADAEYDAAYDARCALEERIVAAPCATLAGLRVKARVAKHLIPPITDTENDWHDTAALAVIDSILSGGLS